MRTTKSFLSLVLLSAMVLVFGSCSELAKKAAKYAIEETTNFENEDTATWGKVIEKDISLPAFSEIDAEGRVCIIFTQDSVCSVRVRANEKCLENYTFSVKNDELKVDLRDFSGSVTKKTAAVTLYVTAPTLSDVDLSGAGKLKFQGPMTQPGELNVELSGAGEVSMKDVTVGELSIKTNGTGMCTLENVTSEKDVEIELNGAGDINANVFCQELSVELNGAGLAVLSGECKHLNCEENGSSKIDFTNLKR